MGKGKAKIEIKKIENVERRNVAFTKRRQGLFKKAHEICRLCPGTRVAALVFSPAGKPYIFGDPNALLGAAGGSLGESDSSGGYEWDFGELAFCHVIESREECLGYDSGNENRFPDLGELASSRHMIESREGCLGCDSGNENRFADLGELESMLMNDSLGDDDFLGDVEAFANQLMEL